MVYKKWLVNVVFHQNQFFHEDLPTRGLKRQGLDHVQFGLQGENSKKNCLKSHQLVRCVFVGNPGCFPLYVEGSE